MPKSVLRAVLGRMQFIVHVTRRTPHGASRLVPAMSAWLVITRRAPSRHSRDARVYGGHAQTEHTPAPPPFPPYPRPWLRMKWVHFSPPPFPTLHPVPIRPPAPPPRLLPLQCPPAHIVDTDPGLSGSGSPPPCAQPPQSQHERRRGHPTAQETRISIRQAPCCCRSPCTRAGGSGGGGGGRGGGGSGGGRVGGGCSVPAPCLDVPTVPDFRRGGLRVLVSGRGGE